MKKHLVFLILTGVIGFSTQSMAQGNLLIFPKRIVFKESEVKKNITLVNTGDIVKTYSVNFTQRRMNSDGSFTEIDSPGPGQNFADAHLRVYPRTVTLQPNESQTVILQRKRNGNMADGEYRSHILFMTMPTIQPIETVKKENESGLSTKITTLIGISIPVILRVGEAAVSINISDLKLEDNILTFNINREGNISIYGDLLFQYTSVNNKPITIGEAKGIAVYTTIKTLNLKYNIGGVKDVNLTEGSLKVIYKAAQGSKQEKFSEATLLLKI